MNISRREPEPIIIQKRPAVMTPEQIFCKMKLLAAKGYVDITFRWYAHWNAWLASAWVVGSTNVNSALNPVLEKAFEAVIKETL